MPVADGGYTFVVTSDFLSNADMSNDRDPFEVFSEDTLKRAEEMCAGFSDSLSLDRRGQTTFYEGAVSDLSGPVSNAVPVTVADSGKSASLTLISRKALNKCREALLVYRIPPGRDAKLIGNHVETRHGRRAEDYEEGNEVFITTFNIVADAGRR